MFGNFRQTPLFEINSWSMAIAIRENVALISINMKIYSVLAVNLPSKQEF